MPTKLANRVKVSVASAPGTNVSVTLGTPLAGFQSFSDAGITDGQTVRYLLEDSDEFEIGSGVYTSSGTTLSRTTVLESSNSGNRIDASALTHVIVTVAADDIVVADGGTFTGNVDFSDGVDVSGTSTLNGTLTSSGTIANDASSTTTYASGATTTFNNNPSFSSYMDLTAINHPTHQEGRVFYDAEHKTLNYYSDISNIQHEIGIEEHQRVYNNTGSTILKGQPLYFSGNHSVGTYEIPTVGLADATDVNAYNAQGLAAGDIANGAEGYCIIAGQIFGVDTSGLNADTNFFVGLTPGAVQNASPTYPNYPMCLGWVVSSHATEGVLLVNQQNHSVNSFRVRTSAHIGTDLQVDGDLTVLGTTTSVSTADVTAGAPFYRANEGDSIGEAGTTFVGTGLDDAFFAGHFTGTTPTTYYVKIDSVGTPDTFAVSLDDFVTTLSTGNAITGSAQLIHSADNISVEFGATTGHTLNDKWEGTAGPTNVDTGFFSNRNTGTTGVGYTHVGMYFDVTDAKWKFLDEYDPVPQGTINPTDPSYNLGTIVAGTFEGALSGNVTGNVTGRSTTADKLTNATTFRMQGDFTSNSFEFDGQSGSEKVFEVSISNDIVASKTRLRADLISNTDELLINKTTGADSGLYKVNKVDLLSSVPITPVGSIMPYAGVTAPAGWLLCTGQEVFKTDYNELWQVIGHNFKSASLVSDGGDLKFGLPDLRGRFPLGVDNMGGQAANRVTGSVASFTNVQQTSTTGTGSGAVFSVQLNAGNYNVQVTNPGTGYTVAEKVTISGVIFGGATPTHDLVITINSLTVGGIATFSFTGIAFEGGGPDTIGQSQGNQSYAINTQNLPDHDHTLEGEESQFYAISQKAQDPDNPGQLLTDPDGIPISIEAGASGYQGKTTTGGIETGGALGSPLNVMNPYLALNYIIYAGTST